MLVPRFPWNRCPRNSRYWSHRGWSRPSCLLSAATRSGVAVCPRIAMAGLPGSRWTMKNTISVMPMSTGTAWSSRPGTNRSRSSTSPPPLSYGSVEEGRGATPQRVRGAALRERSLRLVDVLEVVVAERRRVEALDAVLHRVDVRRVVQVGERAVRAGRLLDLRVQVRPLAVVGLLLRLLVQRDDRRVVVVGERRVRATVGVDGER